MSKETTAESIAAESRDADEIDLLCSDSILDNLTPGKSQGPGEDGTLKATSEIASSIGEYNSSTTLERPAKERPVTSLSLANAIATVLLRMLLFLKAKRAAIPASSPSLSLTRYTEH